MYNDTTEVVMYAWSGSGSIQWEHVRAWDLAASASEWVRGEGALSVPGGFTSLSVFFRRKSQTASTTVELKLYTDPIYFQPLEDDIAQNALGDLLQLTMEPTSGLSMTGTGAQVFGARVAPAQAIGSLLFWRLHNTATGTANIVGDIYIVANHLGVASFPTLSRAVEPPSGPRVRPSVPNMATKLVSQG
jgi:hypothetical protein